MKLEHHHCRPRSLSAAVPELVGLRNNMADTPMNLDGLSSILTGVSGEYFVAAELSRRGYVASVTLRNTRGMDVIATNADASRSVGISVKTNRGKKKDWMVNEKAENFYSDSLFYVFVNLNGVGENPSFHVVPSKALATYVYESHRAWLARPNRSGGEHKDSAMRRFKDPENEYLNRWELLGLDIAAQPCAPADGARLRRALPSPEPRARRG